jgi:hypothetical protein
MRYVLLPVAVVLGLLVVTAAGVAPNADLTEVYSTIARLEARIARLEDARTQGQTVRAPFLVVDPDGSPILSVRGGDNRRLWFGDEDKGGSVELTLGSDRGGAVSVRDATQAVRAAMIAAKDFGQFRAVAGSHSAYLTAEAKEQGAILSLFAGDVPSARIRAGIEGHGAVILTDKSGAPMVRAGMLRGGDVGVVWTGPRTRAGTAGPPSLLQGAK